MATSKSNDIREDEFIDDLGAEEEKEMEKIRNSEKAKVIKDKSGNREDEPKLPIGTKVLWLINKKEYTKVDAERPFSKWTSLNGGTLLIDDDRVLRKDVFEVISKT